MPELTRLTSAGGGPLPRSLRALHAATTRGPRPLRRALHRAMPRLVGARLPEMRATFSDGRTFQIPAGDVMYSQVFLYGGYEPDESRIVASLLSPGDFAVDIGANHGWFTILMGAAVSPGGTVWAVEPVPPMLEALRRNADLNPTLPITIHEMALGREEGEVTLHVFRELVHGHASVSTLGRDDYVEFTARRCPLDTMLRGATAPPAFMKLDVEGAERDVLAGAAALIASEQPPIWMIEVNYETARAFDYLPRDLLRPFDEAGSYTTYRVTPTGLAEEHDPGAVPHGTNWLCVPESRRDRVRPHLIGC